MEAAPAGTIRMAQGFTRIRQEIINPYTPCGLWHTNDKGSRRLKDTTVSERLVRAFRPALVVGIYAALFWGLRAYYWTTTYEAPFSDIGDYVYVGQNIVQHF